ncbi:MAG: hypothetical protein HOV68_24490 [Streptomycetaceae bacterium]|nr:hypothetical protein [Streptomycetaceae bacterium]
MTDEAAEPQDAVSTFAAVAGTQLIRRVFGATEYQAGLSPELRRSLARRQRELLHKVSTEEHNVQEQYLTEVRQGADNLRGALFLPMNQTEHYHTRPAIQPGPDKQVVPMGWKPTGELLARIWDPFTGALDASNRNAAAMNGLNKSVYKFLTERGETQAPDTLVETTEKALEKAVARAMPGLADLYEARDLHITAGAARIEATIRGLDESPAEVKAEAPGIFELSDDFLGDANRVAGGWQRRLTAGVEDAIPALLAGKEPREVRDLSVETAREAARRAGPRAVTVTRDEGTWPDHVRQLAERAGRLAPSLTSQVPQAPLFHLERGAAPVGGGSARDDGGRSPIVNGTPVGDPSELATRLNPRLPLSASEHWQRSTAQPPPPEQLVAAGAGFASVTAKTTAAVVSADQGVNTVDLDRVRVPTRGQVNELVVEPRL